jgi:hypothetical protein
MIEALDSKSMALSDTVQRPATARATIPKSQFQNFSARYNNDVTGMESLSFDN